MFINHSIAVDFPKQSSQKARQEAEEHAMQNFYLGFCKRITPNMKPNSRKVIRCDFILKLNKLKALRIKLRTTPNSVMSTTPRYNKISFSMNSFKLQAFSVTRK